MLKWEKIPHENGMYLSRAPIFGGWLVQMVSEVFTADLPEHYGYEGRQGHEWRPAITFVPDPNHEWDLNTDYTPQKFTYGNR